MNRYLKWMVPVLVLVTVLVSCGGPRYLQNDGRVRNDNWTLLGEQRADSRSRGAAIYPRGRYNNFSQLRFTASGRDIYLYGATVTYDNGRRVYYKLNLDGRNGGIRTVRLRDRNSNIRQIDLELNTGRYDRRSGVGSVFVYGR